MNKASILNAFVESVKDLPAQGSDLWKLGRFSCIGGSEVSTIIKQNKNKSVNKLVLEKLGFDTFTGNIFTYWGNVFEELIRKSCNRRFKCNIVETGSIKYKHGFLSYSPDGLATIDKTVLEKYIDIDQHKLNQDHKDFLTLFEFKCPFSRIPTHEVPNYYLPQVKIGMNIINFLEVGLFVQAVYRRCQISDIKYNTMHTSYGHFTRTPIQGNPIEYGYMALYTQDENVHDYVETVLQSGQTKVVKGVYDIGSLYDSKLFENVLQLCLTNDVDIDYYYNKEYNQDIFDGDGFTKGMYDISLQRRVRLSIDKVKKKYQKKYLIGIIPYKLMDLYITPIQKTHSYIEDNDIHNKAKKVIEFIQDNKDTELDDLKKLLRKVKL